MSQKAIRPADGGTDHEVAFRTEAHLTATRACIKCRETKQLSEFAKDRWKPQGRRSVCASCRAEYDREWAYIRRCRAYGHCPVVEHFTTPQLVERHGDGCYHCGTGAFECVDHLRCVRVGGPTPSPTPSRAAASATSASGGTTTSIRSGSTVCSPGRRREWWFVGQGRGRTIGPGMAPMGGGIIISIG